jgi:hypothetical protein
LIHRTGKDEKQGEANSLTKAKKKIATKKRQGRKATKRTDKLHLYTLPKTAAELGIVCKGDISGCSCGKPVMWFDYELGERNHMSGFVCDKHKVSERVEKLVQPQIAKAAV